MTQLDRIEQKLDRLLTLLEGGAAARTTSQPTFCGYRCSWDIDEAGWPSYVYLEDGSMAEHREKQGHHWFSVGFGQDAAGEYQYGEHHLKFRRATPPDGLLVMPAQAAAEQPAPRIDGPPAGEKDLQAMHKAGRAVHGDEWRSVGPELVLAHTDGRTSVSAEMRADEVASLIAALAAGDATAKHRRRTPEYAG